MYDLSKTGAKNSKVLTPMNDNMDEISYLDVKELYEIAYAALPADGSETLKFNNLLKKAEMLDLAYRAQLSIKEAKRYLFTPEKTTPAHAMAA